jgi:hypothetical protein
MTTDGYTRMYNPELSTYTDNEECSPNSTSPWILYSDIVGSRIILPTNNLGDVVGDITCFDCRFGNIT